MSIIGKPETPSRKEMRKQLKSIERLTLQSIIVLVVSALSYAVAVMSGVPNVKGLPLFFIIGFLLATIAAGLVTGGLLGFIFGIPKMMRTAAVLNQSTEGSESIVAAPAAQTFVGNTNLEEISDWLTKIIVGLTLVEADKLVDGGRKLTMWFQMAVPAPGADMMFALLGTAAIAAGFLFFYLETRTRITLLLVDADAVAGPGRVAAEDVTKAAIDAPVGTTKPLARGDSTQDLSTVAQEDAKLLALPFKNLNKPDEFAAWGAAQARAGKMQPALRALREAVSRAPYNSSYLVILGDTYMGMAGGAQAAVDAYEEARRIAGDLPAILQKELLAALYVPPPAGFQHALATAELLQSKDPSAADNSMVNLWVAAAYGQQYDWLKRNAGSDSEMTKARRAALMAVEKVVRLESKPGSPIRKLLREIFNPAAEGSSASNNDLEAFKDDAEFKRLILDGKAPSAPPG